MVTPKVRFSFVHAFEAAPTPSGDMKFSVCCMLPMTDKAGYEALMKGINAAILKGIEKNTFSKAQANNLRLPLRNGTKEFEAEDRGPEFKDMWFFNASSKNQPGVVGADLQPIMDANEFYSGCWGHADINFFPYNTAGNRGIGVGLNNLMKKEDDDRLDGRMKAEDAFADFAESSPEGDVKDGAFSLE